MWLSRILKGVLEIREEVIHHGVNRGRICGRRLIVIIVALQVSIVVQIVLEYLSRFALRRL